MSDLDKLLLDPSKTEFILIGTNNYTSQIFWSKKLISQKWYRKYIFPCSWSLRTITWAPLEFTGMLDIKIVFKNIIPVSSYACKLGFIFDSYMSLSDQINSVSKSCHFHIRDSRRIRHVLLLSATTALANSLVASKPDYCNSLYSGISQAYLNKFQRIQNRVYIRTYGSMYHFSYSMVVW